MSHLLTLAGSPSPASRTDALVRHTGARLAADGHTVRHVAVRELPAGALCAADTAHPAVRGLREAVADADALVIGSPVYKAAYSGLLKLALDVLPRDALAGKTVLPLVTGGSAAHVLALDYALRPVLTALGCDRVLRGVFVPDGAVSAGPPGGAVRLAPTVRPRLEEQLAALRAALVTPDPLPLAA